MTLFSDFIIHVNHVIGLDVAVTTLPVHLLKLTASLVKELDSFLIRERRIDVDWEGGFFMGGGEDLVVAMFDGVC